MVRFRITLIALPLLVAGCQPSGSTSMQTSAPPSNERVLAAMAPGAPDESKGAASPIDDYRRGRVIAAMRGLRYESGLVEIDAAEAGKIVATQDPDEAAAENARGRQLLDEGMSVEAVAAHTRAVLLAPNVAAYYDALGTALVTKGRIAEALASYRTALKLDPRLIETRYRAGNMLEMLGRSDEAIAVWEDVVAQMPAHADAHRKLAIAHYFQGRYDAAWVETHLVEALGQSVPPQFRKLLEGQMAEPQ
ncbi:MAG: hypothetical protein CHACPFDD_02425 [Phycisphaerae bacterium]|nr:hypothetical protein [Phycisphaerae bacterium]